LNRIIDTYLQHREVGCFVVSRGTRAGPELTQAARLQERHMQLDHQGSILNGG